MSAEGREQPPSYEAPVAQLLGIRSVISEDGAGRATMIVRDEHLQEAGVVQGGLIVTLADHAMYLALRTRLTPGQRSTTVELKVNFISPAKDGELTANARVISAGRRIIVAEVEVTNDREKLIARGLGTSLVLS